MSVKEELLEKIQRDMGIFKERKEEKKKPIIVDKTPPSEEQLKKLQEKFNKKI